MRASVAVLSEREIMRAARVWRVKGLPSGQPWSKPEGRLFHASSRRTTSSHARLPASTSSRKAARTRSLKAEATARGVSSSRAKTGLPSRSTHSPTRPERPRKASRASSRLPSLATGLKEEARDAPLPVQADAGGHIPPLKLQEVPSRLQGPRPLGLPQVGLQPGHDGRHLGRGHLGEEAGSEGLLADLLREEAKEHLRLPLQPPRHRVPKPLRPAEPAQEGE